MKADISRLARVAFESAWPGRDTDAAMMQHYESITRAILTAMREPSEEMLAHMAREHYESFGTRYFHALHPHDQQLHVEAMDAALSAYIDSLLDESR